MASYTIEWRSSARKELRRLPHDVLARILKAVEALSRDPFPPGVRKMVGAEQAYRIRVGDYRIVYDVTTSRLLVEIVRVGHRSAVYD